MFEWSKYNILFKDQHLGFFLYNAFSNVLFVLDGEYFHFLEAIQSDSNSYKMNFDKKFIGLLKEHKILVERGEEKKLLIERHYYRNSHSFDTSRLSLSICPTLKCNFCCAYCFENTQKSRTMMSDETINQLILFIKSFQFTPRLSLSWYGGEPTLAFDIIRSITQRIKNLNIVFEGARLVTNGYLLTEDKIDELNSLNINSVQITLDGLQQVHDSRRVLLNGEPTFEKILNNIALLMNSNYEGSCNIRVNLDKNNIKNFFQLRDYLLDRFHDKKISVYAGLVETDQCQNFDKSCNLNSNEWKNFIIAQYRQESTSPKEGIFPVGKVFNICSANSINSFVVGPVGEIYKCWEDVGKSKMVIGNIYNDKFITNPELVALYNIGTDPYLDSNCQECNVLPICGGGCANRRLRAQYFQEDGLDFCSLYKDHITTLLTEYYDVLLSNELCSDLLSTDNRLTFEKGYRIMQPDTTMQEAIIS